jgi:hypothetical protein
MPHEIASAQADIDIANDLNIDVASLPERPGYAALSRHGTRVTVDTHASREEMHHETPDMATYMSHDEAVIEAKYKTSSIHSIPLSHTNSTSTNTALDIINQFPEGGYGWAVVAASFLINFTIFGYTYAWGVFQSLYLEDVYKDRISTFKMTFVGGIATGFLFLLGPIFSPLCRALGLRTVMIIGTIVQPLGILLASWATAVSEAEADHRVIEWTIS